MNGLFRQAALDKVSNPDQLDRVLQVVRPVHGLGIAVVALVVLGGFLWSILSTAPITVRGHGILLSSGGVAIISSPSEGRVQGILAEPGDTVKAGQTVVVLQRLSSLDSITAKQAELQGARDLLQMRQAAYDSYRTLQADLLGAKREALAEQKAKLQAQLQEHLQRRRDLRALLAKGFATSSKLNEMDTQVADLESRIARLGNDSVELMVQRRGEDLQKTQEIQEARLRVEALERELDNMQRDYDRNRDLKAPVDGTVVEFSVNPGDLVTNGQTLVRLLPAAATGKHAHQTLHAIIFVPNEQGKKVRVGMSAHIMPSTVKLQKDGFIHGDVIGVAKLPSTREGMLRRLKNTALVDTLLKTGAPFEVELELDADPASPSGYRWSSGKGPDISIDAGTIASADVVVGRSRVISLALPAFDYIFRWLGVQ